MVKEATATVTLHAFLSAIAVITLQTPAFCPAQPVSFTYLTLLYYLLDLLHIKRI